VITSIKLSSKEVMVVRVLGIQMIVLLK